MPVGWYLITIESCSKLWHHLLTTLEESFTIVIFNSTGHSFVARLVNFILKVKFSWTNLIKLFAVNLPTLFCKLDLFIAMQQILCMLIKRSSFQKKFE
jgi:hypothetical protein